MLNRKIYLLNFIFSIILSFSVNAQLSGTYTIDKTKSGSTNFKSFNGAVNRLNSSGVNGPVVFKVANGTYTEQVTLLYVSGSSTTNTITFQGNDSTKVELQYNCSQYEAVVKVNAAANFVFKGITIESTNNTYGYGVHITSGAENITVTNSIVKVASRTGVGADCIPINVAGSTYGTYGDNGEKVTIKNSIIEGGYFGINIRGTNNSLLSKNFNIENNVITGQYVYPVYAVFAQDMVLKNNVIDNSILYYAYGVYTSQCAGGEISYNKIYAGRFGLYLSLHNYYNRSDSLVISNNEISDFDDASYQAGIYSGSCFNLRLYHNTIATNGTVSNSTYSCIFLAAPYNHVMVNNNLKASGNNNVFYIGAGSLGSTVIDYNNYHAGTNGALISWQGTTYNDLSSLQSAVSSQNQNSTNEDPLFASSRNLVPKTPGLNNRGLKGYSNLDLAGNARPKAPDNVPDIGAYEYYISPNDIDLEGIPFPTIAKTGNNEIGILIKNNGSKTYSDTVFVQYRIGTSSWVSDTAVFSSLNIGQVDTFYFTKQWNISSSGTFDVCATISPNVLNDPDSLVGDTICTTKCVGRQGTATIDASGNGDYKTFSAAISSLACGIAGPIKFEVKAGTYKERLTISSILGASATNTVTFEGANRDQVILEYDGTSSLPASVLIDDADYISFKNLTIVNQGDQVSSGFWIRENAHDISIENCKILLDSVTANYGTAGILVANSATSSGATIPGNTSHDITIKNNLIVGGSHSIRVNGSGATTTSANMLIENNTIRQFYYQGINTAYISSSKIRKNHISQPRLYTAFGLAMYYSNNDSIDGNYIEGGRYGMYIFSENGNNRNTFTSISNNMVTNMLDPNYQIGLYAYVGYNLTIYHNSIWTTSSFSNAFYAGLNLYYCNNSFVKNNSIKSSEGGMVFSKYYGTISIGSIDNNNYFGNGAAKYYHDGLTFTDLASWKSVKSQFNSNSKEGEPNYNSTTDLHVTGSQLNNSAVKGLGISKDYDGQKRPFSPDKKLDIGADEYYVSPFDLDLVALDSPIVPIIGKNDIKVILRNTGNKALDKDTIVLSFSIDGNLEVRDTVIINSLSPNQNYLYTFSKQWDISTAKSYQLCAQLDTFFKPDPDSLVKQKKCATMCPGAKGTYTIDASGGGDYKTFRGALKALGCGISGSVIFNVKNGTYNERLKLNEVIGASTTNTISFIGESRNGVVLNYTGAFDSMEVIQLEGADNFHFKNLTLKNNSNVYSRGTRISNGADHNSFTNVTFDIPLLASNGYCMSVYISDEGLSTTGNAGNYNVFDNCSFQGGYYGARLYGIGTTSLNYGNEFKNCQFVNHRVFGIYAIYQGEMNIENCLFDSLRLDYYQMYIYMSSQTNLVGNTIRDGRWGLYLIYENYYFQEETSLIANNMISNQSYSADNYAMDIYICYNTKIFHNSLDMGTGTGGSVARFRSGSGHDIRNNSFSKSTNADLLTNSNSSFSEIDFNNYYSGSSSNFVNYNSATYDDLSKWKSAVSGFNRSSKEGNPGYISSTDLTIDPKTTQLANWGSVTTGISTDFEGDIRNPISPDVGADEYSDLYDIGVSSLLSPSSTCELTASENITIEIKNNGNIDVPSGELIPVNYTIDNGIIVKDTFILSSTLTGNSTVNFTFSQKGNFSSHKAYAIKTWTDIANDSLRTNDSLSKSISSFENPKASFSNSTNCTNEDVSFTDLSTISTSSISNYNWSFGNGNISASSNPKTTYKTNGNYSVKLVVTTTDGCLNSLTQVLTLKDKPTAAFTSSSLCYGDSATFSNTSSIATATGATFTWSFDDGNSSSKRNPKNKYSTTGDYDVELIAQSLDGCRDTVVNTVRISPNPVASYSTNNTCKGDSSLFTNTSNVPTGFSPTYAWTFGDGSSSTTESPKYLYGSIGSYKVDLTASLSNGCSSVASQTINIYSKPQPSFTVNNGCEDDSIAFTNGSVIQLDTIQTHSWQFGDAATSSKISPKHLYGADGNYAVKLILTSIKGCMDSVSKSVSVYEKPVAAFSVNTVCESDSSEFINSSSITSGSITSNTWSFGDGFSKTAVSPKHKYGLNGNYSAKLTIVSDKGCETTLTKTAVVNPSPIVSFDVSNICFGDFMRPKNNSTIFAGFIVKSDWDFGDGNSSTQTNPVHKYATKDTFQLKLVSSSNKGCKDSLTKSVIVDSKVAVNYNYSNTCLGDSTSFTDITNINCGSINGYSWDFGDGNSSSRKNPNHKYASTGTYDVKLIVLQNGGVKDSTIKKITINPVPSASYSASNGCVGTSTSFTNSSTISSGTISNYEWLFGDGSKSTVKSPSHTYTSKGNYSIKMFATSAAGCVDSAISTLTTYELPSTSFSVSNACYGTGVSFKNSSSISSGTLSYSWKFGDGFSSTQTSPTYNYASSGTYTVELTSTSNNGCTDSETKSVTIHPQPSANFSTANQCSNKSISFSNSSSISSGTLSYLWKFGDKTSSTAINPSHSYSSPGTYSVTLIVTSNNGCVDSVKKNVSSLPTPIANFTVPSPCSGTRVSFVNSSTISTGSLSNEWFFGDGNTSTSSSPTHTYSSTGTYTVKLITTSISGCKDSISKTVNVYDIPTASYAATGSCLNDSIVFSNNSTLGAGTMTFEWDLGDGTTSTKTSLNHKYTTTGSYQVKLVAISNGGCKDSSLQTINVYPNPSVSFTANNACLGGTTQFSNGTSIASGTTSHFWDFDNGLASTLKSPSIQYGSVGAYTVKLISTSNNGCSDSVTSQVNVYELPIAQFAHANTCLDDTTVFTNNSTIGTGAITHVWNFDDGNTSTTSNTKHRYAKTGSYMVELVATSTYGCQDTAFRLVNINPKATPLFVAPNVCNGQTVQFKNNSSLTKGSYTNEWSFGDGNTSILSNPSNNYSKEGTYFTQLKLTTDSGCISNLTKAVIVNAKPDATFTTNNVCNSDSASFSSSSTINTGKITTYRWSFDDGFTGNLENTKHIYTSAGSYQPQLIVESDSGCTDTAVSSIQVYPMPSADFDANNVCFGDTLYPNNNSSISSGSISGYVWNFGNGDTSSAASPFNYYLNKGTYTIKLVATSNNACKDSISKQVKVDNVVVPGFTFTNICVGEKATFINTTNASCGNISSYQWDFGNGNISSQVSPSATYNSAGAYNVRLIVTEKSGRKDTLIQQLDVYPAPSVSFNVKDTCANTAATFVNNTSISAGTINTYTWSFGNGNKSNSVNPTHNYISSGTYAVKLVAESNRGCTDSLTYNGLEIFEIPVANFTANAKCEYDSVIFSNQSTISTGSLSYSWSFGDLTSSTQTATKHKYALAGKYNVALTATSAQGCLNVQNRSVFINYKPNALFATDTVCIGNSNSFVNNTTITKGAVTNYNWSFGDGFSSSSLSPTHTYSKAGFYSVVLITESDSGCFDTVSLVSGVNPRPQMAFNVANVCLGDKMTPSNSTTISSGTISTWNWNFGDGNTSTSKTPDHTYSSKGTYTVKLVATSSLGCSDSLTKQVVVDNVIVAGFNTNDICLGDTAFFANTTNTSCGTISAYQWKFGDGASSSAKDPFRVYTSAGSYKVELIVVQAGGNRDTFTTTINVSPKPKVNFFANSECQNEQVQFQNLSTVSSGTISNYEWQFGNGSKNTDKNPKYTYSTFGNFSVKLTAQTNLGCIDSTVKTLSIYEVPSATFTVNSVCDGETVDFKNNSTISSGSINYSWSFGDGFSSSQKDPSYKYSSYGTYDVELKVTSNNFCEAIAMQKLKVFAQPSADFTFKDTCENDLAIFTNTSSIGDGSYSNLWSLGDGSNSTALNPSHAYTSSGNYSVKLKTVSTNACADSVTKQISIFQKPDVSFTYSSTCPDKPVTFTNTSTVSAGTKGVLWLFNGGSSSTSSNPDYTFGNVGPHEVILSVQTNDNCIDTAKQTIVFNSVPVADFSYGSICERDSLQFVNESKLISGTASYTWNFGDGNTSNATAPKNYFSNTQNYDVKLVVTSDVGCSDSLIQSVFPLNKPEVDFISNGACLGDTIYFNNQTTDSPENNYKWNFGVSGATSNNYNTKYFYTSNGSFDVLLVVNNINCADSISKSINVAIGPKNLDFTFNDTCARSKVTFNNETTNPNLTFKWVFFDGSFSTQKNPEKYYAKAGTYPIGFEAAEGDCADSTYKLITIHPLADSSFSFIGLGNREIAFTPNDTDLFTYQWNFGDGNTATGYNISHTYSTDGTYKVVLTVTTTNGCSNSSERQIVVQGNSIRWVTESEVVFEVYPNPFSEMVNTRFEVNTENHVSITIYNEIGQVIANPINQMLDAGKYQFTLLEDASKLRSGIYFIRMIQGDQVETRKVILQK